MLSTYTVQNVIVWQSKEQSITHLSLELGTFWSKKSNDASPVLPYAESLLKMFRIKHLFKTLIKGIILSLCWRVVSYLN